MSLLVYDLVVIGAGVSGAAAALAASRLGLSVLLLEGARFPRPKVCAGCLSGKTLKALDGLLLSLPEELVTAELHGLSIWGDAGEQSYGDSHRRIGVTVDRAAFDDWLVKQAQTTGVVFLQGEAVVGLWQDGQEVNVWTNHAMVRARWVIGADGVGGRTAQWAGIRGHWPRWQMGLTWSAVLPVALPEGRAILALCGIPTVWGWVFPSPSGVNVGVGGSLLWEGELRDGFRHLVKLVEPMLPGLIPEVKPLRYPVPAGGFHRRVGGGKVLLVGDAAGLVDPFSGEGIHLALTSGQQAALCVANGEAKEGTARYQQWVDGLLDELRLSLTLSLAMGRRGSFTSRWLCRSSRAADALADWMAGDTNYAQLLRSGFGLRVGNV